MKVGSVCYATKQGLGYLAKDFFDHGVIDEVLVFQHPGGKPTELDWFPGAPVLTGRPFRSPTVDHFLGRIQACVFFETPFDWTFPLACRERNVRTVMVPMYEWFPDRKEYRSLFDQYLCPSLLDLEVFRNDGLRPPEFMQVPVDPSHWKLREQAVRFLHNAGGVGSRNHKGTEELLKAIPLVKAPNVQFRITSQTALLKKLLFNNPVANGDPRLYCTVEDIPRAELHTWGDVYVAPEKFNGLSLPLQEAFAAGMPVVTTDRFPMNSWLPKGLLVPAAETRKCRVMPGHLEIDEAVVEPQAIADIIDAVAATDIREMSLRGKAWGEENSWEKLAPKWREKLEALCELR